MIICFSHHRFLSDLMNKLDVIHTITEKEVYQLRSLPPHKYWMQRLPGLQHFDVDTQTLKYPYNLYKEKIKEKVEKSD
jgi:hypothetical protein